MGPVPRISKRKSVAPTFADEDAFLTKRRGVLPPPNAKSSARSAQKKEAAKRQAERQAAQAERKRAQLLSPLSPGSDDAGVIGTLSF